jgi:hypothetical protein
MSGEMSSDGGEENVPQRTLRTPRKEDFEAPRPPRIAKKNKNEGLS